MEKTILFKALREFTKFKKSLRKEPGWTEAHNEITPRKIYTIDLGAPPKLPFLGAEEIKHEGEGIVEIELRSDDNLYINGKKVILHLSERQMSDNHVSGHELLEEFENSTLVPLNSNVLYSLCEHPELLPRCWERDTNQEPLSINFFGTTFCTLSKRFRFVYYLNCENGEFCMDYLRLDAWFDRQFPSACVTS